jgi:type VI secretion system protein VasD
LAGCHKDVLPPCENPPPFYVTFDAQPKLNPDAQGQSLTTKLLIIQLKGTTRLANADFNELSRNPKETLGEDFVRMDDIIVEPAKSVTQGFLRDPKANYLLVVGLFLEPKGELSRSYNRLADVPPEKCTAKASDIKATPAAGDTQLIFVLQGSEVVNRTPSGRKSG